MSVFRIGNVEIAQDRCAMKVGTDAIALGKWVQLTDVPPHCVLDIGTGTGIIALMLADNNPDFRFVGIDIDPQTVAQANENAARSGLGARFKAVESSVQGFSFDGFESFFGDGERLHDNVDNIDNADNIASLKAKAFSTIVSNPPYFVDSLECPDGQRTMARHASSLTYEDLCHHAYRLLAAEGEFFVIVPIQYERLMIEEATIAGFFTMDVEHLQTAEGKPPKRSMLRFAKRFPIENKRFIVENT